MEPQAPDVSSPGGRVLCSVVLGALGGHPGTGSHAPVFRKLSTVLSVPHQELIIQLQEGGQLPHPGSGGQRGHDAQKEELRLRAPLTWVKTRPTGSAVAGRSGTLQFLGSSFPTSHAMSPQPQALFGVSGVWKLAALAEPLYHSARCPWYSSAGKGWVLRSYQ